MLATLVVTVVPGLAAGALQAVGVIGSWLLSAAVAVALSMALAAVGSAWWVRRPASRDIVFADLMLWGWLRRLSTERRLASARWLLGSAADLDPARQTALLERLSAALEARDPYTHGHSRRVTRHAYRIARQLGLPPELAARIRTAAAVHDVGKIETPREVLNKPGRLSDEEFAVIRRHPVDGARMVAPLDDDELTAIVRHHHERLDGRGYPDGLSGDRIPLGARVIAVADTFDALTSNRPYRPGCGHKKALDILRAEAGKQLDPDVVAAFLDYYSGRRALPWWSAVAAAPSRLAAWALSGVQGATAAPLGGGAAALGATFLVGAALSPAPGEIARPERAETVAQASGAGPRGEGAGGNAAGRLPADSGRGGLGRAGLGDGARGGRGRGRGPALDGRRVGGDGRRPGGLPAPGSGGDEGPGGGTEGGGGSGGGGRGGSRGGGSSGEGGSSGGDDGGNGGGSGGGGGRPGGGGLNDTVNDTTDTLNDTIDNTNDTIDNTTDTLNDTVDTVPDLPGVPDVPNVPDLPDVPDLPKVDLPVLPLG